jgi:hypothetical protein
MIGRLSSGYLITIGLLAGLIMLELRHGAKLITPTAATRLDHAAAPWHGPIRISEKPPAVLAASILARPLFSPTRRPAPSGERPNRRQVVPRLSGVVVYGAKRLAIFAGPRGKPMVAVEGERVGGWVVRLIQPDRVTLVGPGGARRMRPMFTPIPAMSRGPVPVSKPDPVTVAMAASRRALLKLLDGGRSAAAGQ